MKSTLPRLAIAMARAWTRAYTWRMEPALREARRREIESDLWEFQQDPIGGRGLTPAGQILLRLLVGVPDDLYWRAANASLSDRPFRKTMALIATAAALLLVVLWVSDSFGRIDLPPPPNAPLERWMPMPPPDPPPPPPPPPPRWVPAFTGGSGR